MGDIKKYIISKKTRSFTIKLGLWELITDRHGYMGPSTTRKKQNQQAIDRICGLQGIKTVQGGYLHFHVGPKSDHIILWVTFTHLVEFGDNPPPLRSP